MEDLDGGFSRQKIVNEYKKCCQRPRRHYVTFLSLPLSLSLRISIALGLTDIHGRKSSQYQAHHETCSKTYNGLIYGSIVKLRNLKTLARWATKRLREKERERICGGARNLLALREIILDRVFELRLHDLSVIYAPRQLYIFHLENRQQ